MYRIEKIKIGILRALYLGDMLCIIPTVRALKKAYPHSEITLLGLPWERDFVERFHQYFDGFLEFPGWPGLPEQIVDSKRVVEFLQTMQESQFDLLLQMQGNGSITNSMCMLFGAKQVCGLRREHEYCPDPKLFPVSEDQEHEVRRFLKLIDALEIERQGEELEFPILPEEVESFEIMRQKVGISSGNYICVHPGARDVRRRWSPFNFAVVSDRLAAQGYTIVLTGSEEEKELLSAVENKMENPTINLVNEFGQIGLGELAAFINHSAALLCNDTGVSHIASALQVPSVVIFSRFSGLERWSPLNSNIHKVISAEQSDDLEKVFQSVMSCVHNSLRYLSASAPLR
jgi:ADP-heptose:LPS heptosyltransferase